MERRRKSKEEKFINKCRNVYGEKYNYDETYFTKVRAVDTNTFFTKGKLEELKIICDQKQIEVIIFSETLNPLQERNLEDVLDCSIMDREQLILEIFKNCHESHESHESNESFSISEKWRF